MRYFIVILFAWLWPTVAGANSSRPEGAGVTCREYSDYILTHTLTPAGPIPTALDPNGVYPYVSYSETSNRPVLKQYRFVSLENDHVRVTICPDLGGKVTSMVHKGSGREVLYVPDVIRPTRILPRFYFVAGGIEVSFPISHTPSQNETVLYQVDRVADRIYVTCGERELRFGMHWSVEYSLEASDVCLTQRVVFHNPGSGTYPWMSWSNAALPAASDTEYDFPRGEVLLHASVLDTIDWESDGPKTEKDIKEMTGYFWRTKDVNAFGAFTPSLGTGLYHVANEQIADGIKLWSYGSEADSLWSLLSTARHQRYVEIQGGPIGDQSIKLEMKPGETRWHTEYWIPTDRRLDIRQLAVPDDVLRPVSDVPLFSWARKGTVDVWEQLHACYGKTTGLPLLPAIDRNDWAPSGIEDLDKGFLWMISQADKEQKDLWQFHYGAWLAGRERIDDAIRVLVDAQTGVARMLCARLLHHKGEDKRACEQLASISEPYLQLHPQVVVERDLILRSIGRQTLPERKQWLSLVEELPDEWVIERRVQLLIDEHQYEAAKKLLLSTPFQKVHQSYTRTELWMQLCTALRIPSHPIPPSLGEDQLARFGAYREYE